MEFLYCAAQAAKFFVSFRFVSSLLKFSIYAILKFEEREIAVFVCS